jgi:hypothetical protein
LRAREKTGLGDGNQKPKPKTKEQSINQFEREKVGQWSRIKIKNKQIINQTIDNKISSEARAACGCCMC